MNEIAVNDNLRLKITVILGVDTCLAARLVSVYPRMVVAINLQDAKVTALTQRIVKLQQAGGRQSEVQQLIEERENLIICLSRLACADLSFNIEKWRFRADSFLTLLFVASTLLYHRSIGIGLLVDAILVGLLWYSSRLFDDRLHTAQELVWGSNDAGN